MLDVKVFMVKKQTKGWIIIDRERCKGCSLCASVCPQKMIIISRNLNRMGYYPAEFEKRADKACIACAMCATICPDIAIEVYRE